MDLFKTLDLALKNPVHTFTFVLRKFLILIVSCFHQDEPIPFVVVDHVVLHGDGRHHVELIGEILRRRTTRAL